MLALSAATLLLLWVFDQHYPLRQWLFPRYAGYAACALAWAAACLCTGHVALRWILGRSLPLLEQLAVAFGLGVFAFQLLMFVCGAAQLFGPALFVLLPLIMIAAGIRPLSRDLSAALRHLRGRRARGLGARAFGVAALAFGAICLLALYLPILVPNNASYDACWRHLAIAEQYAIHGGLRRYDEGWLFAGGPKFASLIYTWGFLLPGAKLSDRVELCAHLEFVAFVWTTIVGIPALVHKLVPGTRPLVAWSARFLFPGVFLYDSNLSLGTDHLSAVFAPPLLLLGLRAFRQLEPRLGVLLGAFMAAAICTKETAALLFVPPAAMTLAFCVLRGLWPRPRSVLRHPLAASSVAALSAVLLSAPHWLSNLIWYGDPLYPHLFRYFDENPWHRDAAYALQWGFYGILYAPSRAADGLWHSLTTLLTFSFVPNDWWNMHRDVPVFGSLFTLLLGALPFLRRTQRIWSVVLWVHVAIFAWYFGNPYDRHLQAIVPWMTASVAATLALLWRTRSTSVRAVTGLLVAAQLVWGADLYFFPQTEIGRMAPPAAIAGLVAASYRGDYAHRFSFELTEQAIGRRLPHDAVLLVQDGRNTLGYGHRTVIDIDPEQYAIDYPRLTTPRRVYDVLRKLGVTHLTFKDEAEAFGPLAGDIAFYEFARRFTKHPRQVKGQWLAAMPKRPPAPRSTRRVGVLGCGPEYRNGIYELADLTTPRTGPARFTFPQPRATLDAEGNWLGGVFAIAIDPKCPHPLGSRIAADFERVAIRNTNLGCSHEIWLAKGER